MSAHLFSATCNDIVQCPVMTGQHGLAEALYVIRSIAAEYIRQLDHGASKLVHQLTDGFSGRSFCIFSQMRVYTGAVRAAVTQPCLDQPQVDAGFQKMRCPGMAQGVHRGFFADTGAFQCFAKSDLNAAIAYRCCSAGHVFAVMVGRREYPEFIFVAFPLLAQ